MTTPQASIASSTRGHLFSWPILAWLAGLCVLVSGGSMLGDPDSYWHVSVGQWIIEHRSVPQADYFSHSVPGVPWISHEWLSEVFFAALYRLAGWNGLVIATALCFSATLAVMTRFLLRYLQPVHALTLVALAAGMMKIHLLARPHMLVAPLLAAFVAELVRAGESGRRPGWWLLPLITLWANLHGSFTLALALIVAFGVEAAWCAPRSQYLAVARQWGSFLLFGVAAALITPHLWEGFAFTAQILNQSVMHGMVIEWRSATFENISPFEIWLIFLLAAGLGGKIRLPFIRLLLLLGLVHLSLHHQRYIAVLGIIFPFVIAQGFRESWYRTAKLGKDIGFLDRAFLRLAEPSGRNGLVLAAALSLAAIAGGEVGKDLSPPSSITPSAALQALLARQAHPIIFNDYAYGGYLIHAHQQVFIDGRADMYGDKFLEAYQDAIRLKSAPSLTDLLDRYKITATLLDTKFPANALLAKLPAWEKIYVDEQSVVFVRRTPMETGKPEVGS